MLDPFTTDRPASHLPAWDEAFRRVESYLRAHGIESRVQLNALTSEIIAAAQEAAARGEGIEPVTAAMQAADDRIGGWFERILNTGAGRDDRFHARGRLALIMANVPGRWPQHFLAANEPPEELARAMSGAAVQAGPEVNFTNMAPQPIETARPSDVGSGPSSFGRGPLLRAAVMWVAIIGVLGVTWAASH